MLADEREQPVGALMTATATIDDPREGDDQAGTPDLGLVMSYAANMTVESLIERLEDGDIYIPPVGPGCVWSMAEASRLVESLLLGLPVPNLYLFRDAEASRHMVLDGRQRLLAMQGFRRGTLHGRDFRLTGVCEGLMGRSYGDMDYIEQRQLDKALMTATVVYQAQPEDSLDPVLSVFERLNGSCGRLSSQEMRAAVYDGSLNALLSELSANGRWHEVYGQDNVRMSSQELILRFFALLRSLSTYRRPMKQFLHTFMAGHRNPRPPDGASVPKVL